MCTSTFIPTLVAIIISYYRVMFRKISKEIFKLSPGIERSKRKPLKALILGEVLAIAWCLIFSVIFSYIGSWMAVLSLIYAGLSVLIIRMVKRSGNEILFISLFCIQLFSFLEGVQKTVSKH